MNWWHGSSPPMKDCRSGRQPAVLDAKIPRRKRRGDRPSRQKIQTDALACASHFRGSRRRRLLAGRTRSRSGHPPRGIDKPTNVLSFPALQPTGPTGAADAPRMLGDIAIAYETTRREADDEQKPFDHHL